MVDWLRQQAGVEIVEGPGDPQEAVRTRREDVVVVIPDDFAKDFSASKPAQIRLVADSSQPEHARPKAATCPRTVAALQQSEIGSLRLIARGVSPAVAQPRFRSKTSRCRARSSAPRRSSAFIPLFVMIAAFTGAMPIATDSTAGERERGSIEALLVNPAPRGAIAAANGSPGRDRDAQRAGHRAALLFAMFQYIPLQDLGIRFRLGTTAADRHARRRRCRSAR